MIENELVRFITMPKVLDDGFLVFGQTPDHIPFEIKRFYTILKPDPKFKRGFHAHKENQQVLFCINSSVKIVLDNGERREFVILNSPETGIFLDKMIWHEMHEFKKDTMLLVLASKPYDPSDYIRNYQKFLEVCKAS